METVTRQVQDLGTEERQFYESLLGQELRANQQVIVQVVTADEPSAQPQQPIALPGYFNVYDGMSDEEIEELESLILDRSPSRSNS